MAPNELIEDVKVHKKSKKCTKVARLSKSLPVVGDLCFAKVRGFVEWPAIVKEVYDGGVWVDFFNSNTE